MDGSSQPRSSEITFDDMGTFKALWWIRSKSSLLLETRTASAVLLPGQLAIVDFQNVQLIAHEMGLDVVDLTNERLDHLSPVTITYFGSSDVAVSPSILATEEKDPDLIKLCANIPDDMPIIQIFLDPDAWRNKKPAVVELIRK